jgi:hypothetical protein
MAEKNFTKKGLRGLFFMVLTVVLGSFVASCDNEEYDGFGEAITSTEVIKKPSQDTIPEKAPELDFYLIPVHEANGNQLSIADTIGERTTNTYWIQSGKAKLSLKEYDYITEMKYKVLNVAYANANKSMAEPEISDVNGSKRYVTKCSFSMEDGNVGYINADSYQRTEKVNGQAHTWPYAKLGSFEIISLNNVDKAATRGEMYIADSCYTEVKANLHYVYENSNVPAFDVILTDTCFRKFLAADDVDHWDVENKSRKVLTSTTERCDFTKVAYKKSGDVERLEKSIVLNYGIFPIDEYELLVKSFSFGNGMNGAINFGTAQFNRTEGSWTVNRRDFTYGAGFATPMGDNINTKYTGFSESADYNDGDVRVEFPMIDMSIREGNTNVNSIAGDDWYDKARFNNNIVADYQGYTQNVSEDVILKKEAVHQTFEGWDDASEKKTITLWTIHTEIDYVIRNSDGSEERTHYSFDFGWSFGPKSKWSVFADSNSYYTGNVVANVSSSQKSKDAKDGAVWNWNENSHSFIADVNVANGVQHDEWEAVTVNDITITRNGNVHNFGHDDYSMTDGGAKLGGATSTDSEDVYPYTHSLTFGMGGVTDTKTVNGEIHVAKAAPEIPTFFGQLESMSFIVSNNPEHTDYLYTALAHLKGGRVIPGVWNKNGEIKWYVEDEQAGSNNLNGCAYDHSTGKWVPVRGWDSPDCLQYDTQEGANADNQSYATALQWNWDEGAMVSGHPSVTTDRISYTMDNGVVSVVDARHGVSLGSWTYKQ